MEYTINKNYELVLSLEKLEPEKVISNVSIIKPPENGDLLQKCNNTLIYIPNEDYIGSDSFTVLLNDDELSKRKVSISVEDLGNQIAITLSREAKVYLAQYASMKAPDVVNDVFDIYSETVTEQLNILKEKISSREPSDYVVLNEVSAYADREKEIYSYPNFPTYSLKQPINWSYSEGAFEKRSWRYGFNAWVFMDSLLKSDDLDDLVYAKDLMLDWIRFNLIDDVSYNEFAWYDMGVAFRATRIPYIIQQCVLHDLFTEEEFVLASLLLKLHILDLVSMKKLALHSNHGLYQLAGLLAITSMLPEVVDSQVLNAFAGYHFWKVIKQDINIEGVHLEHSPDYHIYITDILFATVKAGWIKNEEISIHLSKVFNIVPFLLHPTNFATRFGDTSDRDARSIINKEIPELLYMYSNGKKGTQPKVNNAIFEEAGYAFFRSEWDYKPWSEASYLAFSAAFHKRTHKHADDFTFEWSELGYRLIIDAGKYGYEKEAIERKYVESTRAHNTVEIDGEDYSRYNLDIFGSAITAWNLDDEIKVVEANLYRKRFFKTHHRRTLFYSPGKWLAVIDFLHSPEKHDYIQWFHFHPDLRLIQDVDELYINLDEQDKQLRIDSLISDCEFIHERGSFEPKLQGWTSLESYKLVPNDALGFRAQGEEGVFATVFSIADPNKKVSKKHFKIRTNGKYIRLGWLTPENEKVDIVYRIDEKNNTREMNYNETQYTIKTREEI